MATPSLPDLISQSEASTGPRIPPPQQVRFGGIDPLGLRQTNFDLMDLVFPGVNNVARHIRPFTVVSWAWRRAGYVAAKEGREEISVALLQDFVARIEVLYVWSQFLRDRNADLPGRDVFAPLLQAEEYAFLGKEWKERQEVRRYSTALSSPINYGPSLKTLGWVVPHPSRPGVLMPSAEATAALNAFEKSIAAILPHPAFNQFEPITVQRAAVADWSQVWPLGLVTAAERDFMRSALRGAGSPIARQQGLALVLAADERFPDADRDNLRRFMCDAQSNSPLGPSVVHTSTVWNQIQVRQLFRLALESLLYWLRSVLADGPRTTSELVELFLDRSDTSAPANTTREWLRSRQSPVGPVELIDRLNTALSDPGADNIESTVADAIALALREKDAEIDLIERNDRLPLSRVRREAQSWGTRRPKEFVRHILESWILAQHVYWSVGRGLADARARGKSILRLKIVLEEGGWTLTPSATVGSPPAPAGDRLETILSLAAESGLIPNNHH